MCMSCEALSPTKRSGGSACLVRLCLPLRGVGGSACLGGYQFYDPRSGQCLD